MRHGGVGVDQGAARFGWWVRGDGRAVQDVRWLARPYRASGVVLFINPEALP